MSEDKIYDEIRKEREYQIEKWGTEADDKLNTPSDWVTYIGHYSTSWLSGEFRPYPKHVLRKFRTSMIKVAALGVAAAAWADRLIAGEIDRPDVVRNEHPLVENVERALYAGRQYHNAGRGFEDTIVRLNRAIVERHPELFPEGLVMGGPVANIPTREGGKTVEATTRQLAVKVTLAVADDNKPFLADRVFDLIVEDIAAAIKEEQDRLKQSGSLMCPYVVALSNGPVIDPTNFQPILAFITRYGVLADGE